MQRETRLAKLVPCIKFLTANFSQVVTAGVTVISYTLSHILYLTQLMVISIERSVSLT